MIDPNSFRLVRPKSPLPSEHDFDPWGGDLDAQCALKNFGGMSLQLAYELFLSSPEFYQADFMYMGWEAFAYYFPVVDRYLRSVTSEDEWDDCEAAILGSAVKSQLDREGVTFTPHFLNEIEELSSFVQSSVVRYSKSESEQARIRKSWEKIDKKLEKY